MQKIKWLTTSSWINDTIDLFNYIDENYTIDKINKLVKNGKIFGNKKINAAKRLFGAIKARYLNEEKDKVIALSIILNSNMSIHEKQNYLLYYFLNYETLAKLYMEEYVYEAYKKKQKIFTKRDMDTFMNKVFIEYEDFIPDTLSETSISKGRNQLCKFLEDFGWGKKKDEKLYLGRQNLNPKWFVYGLYYYFEEETIDINILLKSNLFKKFLLSEYEVDYLINQANILGYIDVQKLGDIRVINKLKQGMITYARFITRNQV